MATKPKIQHRAPGDLIPYARNAKKHGEHQVNAIAGSIKEFGFNNPVLIDGENGIIAGHGRVLAAEKLGLEYVPCIVLDHLTDTQRRAYTLADNKLAEIGEGWDIELLSLEIRDLADDIDLTLAGFDVDEMGDIMLEQDGDGDERDDVEIHSVCEVIAECGNESEQESVYQLLTEKGIKCRVVTL